MIIRPEQASDALAIAALVEQAFGQKDEAGLVDQLRAAGDAIISLVAVQDDSILGHVLFSVMTAPLRALGLAPVSVLPSHQRRGIGQTLIREGLRQAKELNWQAVFVLGDNAYYEKFEFSAELTLGIVSPYAGPHFMALSLGGDLALAGIKIDYSPAFAALG